MGGVKQAKKKTKKAQHAAKTRHDRNSELDEAESRAQQEDEWTAISAIFQDESRLLSKQPHLQYSILLGPLGAQSQSFRRSTSHGESEEQVPTLELTVRYTTGYPHRPPRLQVFSKGGLQEHECRQLLELLNDQAATAAKEGRVTVYNLAETAQEFLTQLLPASSPEDQQADKEEAGVEETEAGEDEEAGGGGWADGWGDAVNVALFGAGEGLLGDASLDGSSWRRSGEPQKPHGEETGIRSQGKRSSGKRERGKGPEKKATDLPKTDVERAKKAEFDGKARALNAERDEGLLHGDVPVGLSGNEAAGSFSGPSKDRSLRGKAEAEAGMMSEGGLRYPAGAMPGELKGEPRSWASLFKKGGEESSDGSTEGEHGQEQEQEDSESEEVWSSDVVRSKPGETDKVRSLSSFFQRGDGDSDEDESEEAEGASTVDASSVADTMLSSLSNNREEEEEEEDEEEEEEDESVTSRALLNLTSGRKSGAQEAAFDPLKRDKVERMVQRDLLLGHMLQLLVSADGPLPRHALPALTQQLKDMRLLPTWLADMLVHKPDSVNSAFARAVPGGRAAVPKREQSTTSAGEEKSGDPDKDAVDMFWSSPGRGKGDGKGPSAGAASRYLSDFEEEAMLGKGGFGQVILCTNRMDGRKYAVKRIPLKGQSAVLNSKILREVATLSRLQHHNVVRYYQAWFETGVGRFVGMLDATSDGVETTATRSWLTGDTQGGEEVSGIELLGAGEVQGADEGLQGPGKGEVTSLYIQMEFCPRTLRQVLDSRPVAAGLDKDWVWRIFRQIVDGLVHIHSQGVVHRDLNPSNIFFDSRGDVKIGDFGLAKFTNLELTRNSALGGADGAAEGEEAESREDRAKGGLGQSLEGVLSSRPSVTGHVGTYFYTAPENEQGWAQTDDKVDIYSLGVVLLELWHPFETLMERAMTLTDLKRSGKIPDRLQEHHPQVAQLIWQLVAPLPANRPSAKQVQQSPLVPPRMEDEALNAILRTIESGEDASVYDKVVSSIFSSETRKISSASAGAMRGKRASAVDGATQTPLLQVVEGRELVLAHVRRVFELHRAVATETPILVEDPHGEASRLLPRALDASGVLLSFRYETRRAFAKWIMGAQSALNHRRYEISRVFRKGAGRAAPLQFFQADYDVVVGPTSCASLAEAETLKVSAEVVSLFPEWQMDSLEFRVNHRSLLAAVWEWSGTRRTESGAVAQLLSVLSGSRPGSAERKTVWPFIRRQLLQGHGLPKDTVDRLQLVEQRYSGPAQEVLPRLRGALPSTRQVREALEEVTQLLAHLRVWGLDTFTTLDPLMPPSEHYFSGLFYQIHVSRNTQWEPSLPVSGGGGGRGPKGHGSLGQGALPPVCVGVGGRYDALLKELEQSAAGTGDAPDSNGAGTKGKGKGVRDSAGAAGTGKGAVGLSLALHTLMAGALNGSGANLREMLRDEAPPHHRAHTAPEVLVCSRGGGGRLEERMEVAALLWRSGVPAELVSVRHPSLTEQYEHAKELGLKWLVLVTDAGSATGTVKVRNTETRAEEEEVLLSDLPKFLLDAAGTSSAGAGSVSRRHARGGGALGVPRAGSGGVGQSPSHAAPGAEEHGLKWVVRVGEADLEKDRARVRVVEMGTEEEVPIPDLPRFFHEGGKGGGMPMHQGEGTGSAGQGR